MSESRIEFKITKKMHVICIVAAYIACYFMRKPVTDAADGFYNSRFAGFPTQSEYINVMMQFLILTFIVVIIHELCHGLAYLVFGRKVKFGRKGLIFVYTQDITGAPIEKWKFMMILYAPLFLMTAAALPFFSNHVFRMFFFFNLFGSVGDIYMSLIVMKHRNCVIEDREYGLDIIKKQCEV